MLDLNVLQLVMVLQKSLVLPWTDFQFMDQALIQPMAKSGAKMIWMIVVGGMMPMEITDITEQEWVGKLTVSISINQSVKPWSKSIFHIFFNVIVVHRTHQFDRRLEIVVFGEQAVTIPVLAVVKARDKDPVKVAGIALLDHLVLQDEKSVIIRAKRMVRKKETKEAKEVQQQNGFKPLWIFMVVIILISKQNLDSQEIVFNCTGMIHTV